MAAGLAIREENLTSFSDLFRATARMMLSDDDLQPHLRLDHELALTELNMELLRWHEMLQPFGNANPQPVFLARDVAPAAPPRVIKDKHLVLNLRQKKALRRAVYFDGASQQLPPHPWDIAFSIRPDDYDGEKLLSIQIHGLRPASSIP